MMLEAYCNVTDCEEATSAEEALELLSTINPDVMFLDVQMPGMNGIELAGKVKSRKIPIVFVTAYDHYALQALKASAVDYLLKPTKIDELQDAVEKVRVAGGMPNHHHDDSIETLATNLETKEGLERIMVPWDGGFKIVDLHRVFLISSDNTYCELYMEKERVVVSRSIGDFENMLQESGFYRLHYRHMINLAYLDTFTSKDGGQALLKNGMTVPISRRRLAGFKEAAESFFKKQS